MSEMGAHALDLASRNVAIGSVIGAIWLKKNCTLWCHIAAGYFAKAKAKFEDTGVAVERQ